MKKANGPLPQLGNALGYLPPGDIHAGRQKIAAPTWQDFVRVATVVGQEENRRVFFLAAKNPRVRESTAVYGDARLQTCKPVRASFCCVAPAGWYNSLHPANGEQGLRARG